MPILPQIIRANILRNSGVPAVVVVAISDLAVTATTSTTITLGWTNPIGGTNPIANFKFLLGGVLYDTTTDDTPSWTLTGLTASTSYSITAITVDSIGNESVASNIVVQSTAASGLLLDTDYGQIHGYSHRKLRTAYAGNAITVVRSSDSTSSNIGFASNELDESALTTFVGSNNGKESKMFDQVGSRDLAQSTDAQRPDIVVSGTVQKSGTKPFAQYTDDYLRSASGTSIMDKNSTVYVVLESQSGTSQEGLFEEVQTSSSGRRIILYSDRGAAKYIVNSKPAGAAASFIAFGSAQPSPTRRIFTYRKTGTLIEAFAEGVKVGDVTDSNTFSGSPVLEIGMQLISLSYFTGKATEVIVCSRAHTAPEMAAIVADMKAFYSIT